MLSSHFNPFTDLYWFVMIVNANESFFCLYAYLYSVENLSDLYQDIIDIVAFLSAVPLTIRIVSTE